MSSHDHPSFSLSFTAGPDDIDELGHVNNAAWVKWIQDVATAHWYSAAPERAREETIWVVVRHEIDYLRALLPGESVIGTTWIPDAPRGARFDRMMEFVGVEDGPAPGKAFVRARTTWAMIDRATGRPQRVSDDVIAAFRGSQ